MGRPSIEPADPLLRSLEELWTKAGDDRAAAAKKLGIKADTLKRKLAGSRGFSIAEAQKLAKAYGAAVVVLERSNAESLIRTGLRVSRLTERQRDAILDHYRADVQTERTVPKARAVRTA